MNLKALGQNIKKCRETRGLTQKALAKQLELSEAYIRDIERGLKTPSLKSFVKIANCLNVSAEELLIEQIKSKDSKTILECLKTMQSLSSDEKKEVFEVYDLIIKYAQNKAKQKISKA